MAIVFRIPTYLAGFANGQSTVTVETAGGNTRQALEALFKLHPGLHDRILDERGEVRQHINIFVGNEAIRFAEGLETAVPSGAEVMIVPAVSGG
jgi:molybdopterin converting factor small subunit